MLAIISSIVASLKFIEVMYCPSRMMVTLSTMCWSSSSLCEIYTIPQPFDFKSRIIRNKSSISLAVSADVGSSMIRILALVESAFAISTICCMDTGRSPTTCCGRKSIFSSSRILCASASISEFESMIPFFFSLPRNIFSATERWRHIFNS